MTEEQNDLVLGFIAQAKAIANSYANRRKLEGDARSDYQSVAYEASCNAAVSYSPDKGPFGAYAATAVRNELVRFNNRERRLVLSEDSGALGMLGTEQGILPHDDAYNGFVTCVDYLVDPDSDPAREAEQEDLEDVVLNLMGGITEEERDVLCCLYGLVGSDRRAHTTRECAEVMNSSESAVRRTRDRALRKLRNRI